MTAEQHELITNILAGTAAYLMAPLIVQYPFFINFRADGDEPGMYWWDVDDVEKPSEVVAAQTYCRENCVVNTNHSAFVIPIAGAINKQIMLFDAVM